MGTPAHAPMSAALQAALARADADASARPFHCAAPDGRRRRRRLVLGDPQAPLPRVLEILERHAALAQDGRIADDVQLVSIGDHFDWGTALDRPRARHDGLRLLAFFAAHPADQVVLVLGNHDLGRVGELAALDDAQFLAAQAEADAIYRPQGAQPATDPAAEAAFVARHGVCTAELVARDLGTFAVVQRELVTQLLHAGRFVVAHAAARELLACHAGVTRDDLDALGLPRAAHADANAVASALNAALSRALASHRPGEPLRMEPLHRPGLPGQGEGRGIFFQRASNPDGPRDRGTPELFEGPPRRRFDPRLLPLGLTQVIGHVRDAKCRELLEGWHDGAAGVDGPLRHLVTDGRQVRYARGVPAAAAGNDGTRATLLFTDGGMLFAAPDAYELLDLDTRAAAQPGAHPTRPAS